MGLLHKYQNGDLFKYIIYSKKSPTRPIERTPKHECLIALVRYHFIFDGILQSNSGTSSDPKVPGPPSDFHSQPRSPPSLEPSRHQDQTWKSHRKKTNIIWNERYQEVFLHHPTFMNHVNLWPEMKMQSSSNGRKIDAKFFCWKKPSSKLRFISCGGKPGKWENQSWHNEYIGPMKRGTQPNKAKLAEYYHMFFIVCLGKNVENWKCQLANQLLRC